MCRDPVRNSKHPKKKPAQTVNESVETKPTPCPETLHMDILGNIQAHKKTAYTQLQIHRDRRSSLAYVGGAKMRTNQAAL
jgi:hypothetical protein